MPSLVYDVIGVCCDGRDKHCPLGGGLWLALPGAYISLGWAADDTRTALSYAATHYARDATALFGMLGAMHAISTPFMGIRFDPCRNPVRLPPVEGGA